MSVRRTGGKRSRGGWGPTLAIIGALGVVALGFVLVPRMLNAQAIVALPNRFVAVGTCVSEDPCGVVVAIGTPTASAVTKAPTLPPKPQ